MRQCFVFFRVISCDLVATLSERSEEYLLQNL